MDPNATPEPHDEPARRLYGRKRAVVAVTGVLLAGAAVGAIATKAFSHGMPFGHHRLGPAGIAMLAAAPGPAWLIAIGPTLRSKAGQLVPLSSFATVERTVGPTAINHVGQLQAVTVSFNLAPGARAGRRDGEDRAVTASRSACRASIITSYGGDAAVFQSSQGSQAMLHRRGAARDLRAARRALRELHPPADDPRRPAVGGGRRAADAEALRPGPDADRDHRHPAADRHREEERDHDDRLRARRAARRRAWRRTRRSARPACCASGRS